MAVIAHLSDLHFGRTSPAIVDALVQAVNDAHPTLVVVSGDLTQRGRDWQYQAAVQFLARLPRPQIVVPGNHDVPLLDLYRRLFRPVERFTRLVTPDLWPTYRDAELFVLGVNTTRAFTPDVHGFWKNGALSDEQLAEIGRRFADVPAGVLKVLVMHHPLFGVESDSRDAVCRRLNILPVLEKSAINVVLSGHLHRSYQRRTLGGVLCLQAGTGCSTRYRDEPNAFNLLRWDCKELAVRVFRYAQGAFVGE
jgi:3',5'-cyclic AMP phosphodiesterase CpdA